MKKKIVSLLLCSAMVVSLAGCGGQSAETGSTGSGTAGEAAAADGDVVTLTWWCMSGGWNPAFDQAIEAFEADNPNIKIVKEEFPYNDLETKVQTSLINGEAGADLYLLWGGWALDFVENETMLPLSDEFAAQLMEECYEPTYGVLTYNDKLYGVPLEFNMEYGGILVNKPMMEEKGIAVPTTWEELRAAGIAGTETDADGNITVNGFNILNRDDAMFYLTSLILQQGGEYMTADGKFDFTTPEAKTAFEEMASMATVDHMTDALDVLGGSDMEDYQRVYAGDMMMCVRGPWVIGEGTDSFGLEIGTDFDFVACPWYGDNHRFVAENGWSLAANAKTSHPEEAMKFLDYVYQDDVMREINITCNQIPAKKSIAESAEYVEAVPYVQPLLDILGESQFVGRFNSDRLKSEVSATFANYILGQYGSAEEALEDLTIRANEILAK